MRVDGGKSTVGPRHKSETAEEKKRREQLSLRKAKKRRKDREEKELARIEMAEEKEEEDDEDYGLNNESAGIKKTTKTHRKRPLKSVDQEDDQEDSDKLVFKKRKHKKHRSARDKEYETDSNESSSASYHHHNHNKHKSEKRKPSDDEQGRDTLDSSSHDSDEHYGSKKKKKKTSSIKLPKTKLFRKDIPAEVKIVDSHASSALERWYPGRSKNSETSAIQDMKNRLQMMRNKIIHEMKNEVVSIIIKEARKQRLLVFSYKNELVSHIRDITEVWVKSSDRDNHRKIWMSFFGQFDMNDYWDWDLEERFMSRCNYRYRDNTASCEGDYEVLKKSDKGCIAKVIRSIKNALIKNLNAASRRVGKKLTIERPAELVKQQPSFRRKQGKFYEWMVRWDEKITGSPSSDTKKDDRTRSPSHKPRNKSQPNSRHSSVSSSSLSSSSSSSSDSSSTSDRNKKSVSVSGRNNKKSGYMSQRNEELDQTPSSSTRGGRQLSSDNVRRTSSSRRSPSPSPSSSSSDSSSTSDRNKKSASVSGRSNKKSVYMSQRSEELDQSPSSSTRGGRQLSSANVRRTSSSRRSPSPSPSSSSSDSSSKRNKQQKPVSPPPSISESSNDKIRRLEAQVKTLNGEKEELIQNNSSRQGTQDRVTMTNLKSQLLKRNSGAEKSKVAAKAAKKKDGTSPKQKEGKNTTTNETTEYFVKALLDVRVRKKKEEVLVFWTTKEESWEPVSEIAKTHKEEIEELKSALAETRPSNDSSKLTNIKEKSREKKQGKVSLFYLHVFQ